MTREGKEEKRENEARKLEGWGKDKVDEGKKLKANAGYRSRKKNTRKESK